MSVRRIFIEKKQGFFDVEAQNLCTELVENFRLTDLKTVRIFYRYDIEGISDLDFEKTKNIVFAEPNVDALFLEEELPDFSDAWVFVVEYLPGQYDIRADMASECVEMITQKERPLIKVAKVFVLLGNIEISVFLKIKDYLINPIECRESNLDKPETLRNEIQAPKTIDVVEEFNDMDEAKLATFLQKEGFSLDVEDLKLCQEYYRKMEKRPPTMAELHVIDTYWSDHCRHRTFHTIIDEVAIEEGIYKAKIEAAYNLYQAYRDEIYPASEKNMSLMDLATIGTKGLLQKGLLTDVDISDENNACTIKMQAEIDGKNEDWYFMFKNETHNHPTEIEPFGGAATCLGGAIRDPLSARAYVYGAMRLTGAGDPRADISTTILGKLPQKKITRDAARGYSSYGNQIGVATGAVREFYHAGFVAKRFELGAVIAATPVENVIRAVPQKGDLVLLIGGRTGRDGIGGATGSSKVHTRETLSTARAEVQKGNPLTERKIQRLFRHKELTRLIKRCNDLGAGGIAVGVGELADGVTIELDRVLKKYEGLNGMELLLSESQERMVAVIDAKDFPIFMTTAKEENIEVVPIATINDSNRFVAKWNGEVLVDISREFLNTNGVLRHACVKINSPREESYFAMLPKEVQAEENLEFAWKNMLSSLNIASQIGLVEQFDSTVGANTVFLPLGGRYQLTPTEGMVFKLPVFEGETKTATAMTYGFNPYLMEWSPFHGGVYAIVEAVAKIVALGGFYQDVRLSLQEYFEKLGDDVEKWGKPFNALLGALWIEDALGIPAIGGKDSMSGTFGELAVPPSLAAFAVAPIRADEAISTEFKFSSSDVYLIPLEKDEYDLPNIEALKKNYASIYKLVKARKILAAGTVTMGGIASAITKMCLGNRVGFKFSKELTKEELFRADYGSIIIEVAEATPVHEELKDTDYYKLGRTTLAANLVSFEMAFTLKEAYVAYVKTLESVFPSTVRAKGKVATVFYKGGQKIHRIAPLAKPHVLIPVFPGTNCEYETERAFLRAGATVSTLVMKNLSPLDITESIEALKKAIAKAQIVVLPGGFSGADEPLGSGKFIVSVLRNRYIAEEIMRLLKRRDGLMIGICNGFQALIKLGLLPYGEIRDLKQHSPTLTYNQIGRHVSRMVFTKVISNLSPWFNKVKVGDMFTTAVSHGEGRFYGDREIINKMRLAGQLATQYVDELGNATMEYPANPNGSIDAIEGITSPDGRVLGKMGHAERIGQYIGVNVEGLQDQKIFEAGVEYYK